MKIKKIRSVSLETEVMRIIHFQYKMETGGCTFDNVRRQAKFDNSKYNVKRQAKFDNSQKLSSV